MSAITPFRAEIPQAGLDDLHERLDRVRWPDELPGVGWDLGIPLERVRELAAYWRERFDWRAQEAGLNQHPQYTTEIDGQNVHFLHIRAAKPGALPLVLTHGWPGSVLEFLDVIGPLSADFHLVIPSIPGFGFSGPTKSKGWDIHRIARAWAVLMSRLGYQHYGAHGGDWGSGISRALGAVAPEHVVGVHLTYLVTPPPAPSEVSLSPSDQARLAKITQLQGRQPAYQALHATRPQTISYALTDSPAGQLAWIAEKFTEWADPRSTITLDQILAEVSVYWFTATAGSSARSESPRGKVPCPVPVGVVVLPYDILQSVRPLAEQDYDIVHWTEFDRGGHFPGLEVPGLLAADIRDFFCKLRVGG
jgi:pimeloyl-ACP methyl ester carboxylesterase